MTEAAPSAGSHAGGENPTGEHAAGSAPTPPPDPLDLRLGPLARAERLLVASDFDGTLAPIVGDPDAARADPDALATLNAIGALPDTRAAIISGRSRGTLLELIERSVPGLSTLGPTGRAATDGVILIGSHGAERESGGLELAADQRATLHRVVRDLERIAADYPGAVIESKPGGAAFHFRRVQDGLQEQAVSDVLSGPAREDGVRAQRGRKVVELLALEAGKGTALQALRDEFRATAVLFVGDDETDEDAFRILGPSDLGVKVGDAPSAAPVRVADTPDVRALLRRLYELRLAAGPGRARR